MRAEPRRGALCCYSGHVPGTLHQHPPGWDMHCPPSTRHCYSHFQGGGFQAPWERHSGMLGTWNLKTLNLRNEGNLNRYIGNAEFYQTIHSLHLYMHVIANSVPNNLLQYYILHCPSFTAFLDEITLVWLLAKFSVRGKQLVDCQHCTLLLPLV